MDRLLVVVFVVLVLLSVFRDTWFNLVTEHTRAQDSQSKIVFLELNK